MDRQKFSLNPQAMRQALLKKALPEDEDEEFEYRLLQERVQKHRAEYLTKKETHLRKLMEIMPAMFAAELKSEGTQIFYDPPLEQFPEVMVTEVKVRLAGIFETLCSK